jgi:uncharacterized protein YjbJ (UPF0337 family)
LKGYPVDVRKTARRKTNSIDFALAMPRGARACSRLSKLRCFTTICNGTLSYKKNCATFRYGDCQDVTHQRQVCKALRAASRNSSWRWPDVCIKGTVDFSTLNERRLAMNKDQVKGTAEKAKGKINEGVGKMTGDTGQQVKGQVQQGAGEARKQYGDAKEEVKKGQP